MTNKVTKAVIPAAGFGTRFLPQVKAMPKEMLPVVDKPVIQYVVEECVASGITDIIIITGANKRAIEDHFDVPNADLVNNLKSGNKLDRLEEVKKIANLANFIYIRQKGPYGNGTPVLCAEPAIGNEPFAVIWGDEFIYADPPRLKQCLDVYQQYQQPVISGVEVADEDLHLYGIGDLTPIKDNVFQINKIVEKPSLDEAPSRTAVHGCYVLPPEIFPILKNLKPGKGGEIWLPDAITELAKSTKVLACQVQNGRYYDTGNKLAYMQTVVEFALRHPDINGDFREYLQALDLNQE
jgi:UTP--glucose-1-phosphate uridylyltransferase